MSSDDAVEAFYSALLEDDAEALYERAPCGYLSTTPDGTIVKVNGTFLTLTGHDRADLVGRRRFAELLTAGGRIYHETHYAPMLQMQGTAREIALDIVRADGSRLPVLVNSVLERSEDGVPLVVRTAVFDATDRRGYERELLEAKRRAEASEAEARLLARTLQQTLIPPAPPKIPRLDVAAAYRPAGDGSEVGGDFYDIFEVANGDWIVAIGDVCGKGVEAAVVTALLRSTIRSAAVRNPRPGSVLDAVNDALVETSGERFSTVALLWLRRRDVAWSVSAAAGGHPLPVLIRSNGVPTPIGAPGSLLGVLATGSYHEVEIDLRPGDAVVLYTDGVTEGRRGEAFFEESRLHAAMRDHRGSADSLVNGILADVLTYQSSAPRDDIAIVGVQVPGPTGTTNG